MERVIFGKDLLTSLSLKAAKVSQLLELFLLSQDVSQPSLGILLGGDSLRIFARKRTTSE